MGGKILQLESERLRELGEAKGRKTERIEAIQNMISLGLTKEKILTVYSEEEYNEAVINACGSLKKRCHPYR